MSTKKIKHESRETIRYRTDDVWAVANKTDQLVAVGLGKYKVKAIYVGMFETLEGDDDNVETQFAALLKENNDTLVQLESIYTVVKDRVEK